MAESRTPQELLKELEETLESREVTYGHFSEIADLSTSLRKSWTEQLHAHPLYSSKRLRLVEEAGVMILHKLSRLACGIPSHRDSWMDIAGYALRTAMELERIDEEMWRKIEQESESNDAV